MRHSEAADRGFIVLQLPNARWEYLFEPVQPAWVGVYPEYRSQRDSAARREASAMFRCLRQGSRTSDAPRPWGWTD